MSFTPRGVNKNAPFLHASTKLPFLPPWNFHGTSIAGSRTRQACTNYQKAIQAGRRIEQHVGRLTWHAHSSGRKLSYLELV